jgi:ComF family protein
MRLAAAPFFVQVGAAVLRGLLAPACPACFEPLDLPETPLCRRCQAELSRERMFDLRRCVVCDGYLEKIGAEEAACQRCRHQPPAYGKLRAAVRYNAQAQALVHQLKFERRMARAPFLAERMAAGFHREWGDDFFFDALIPTPLHPWRRWRRGFNQSELLAEGLGEHLGKPVERDLLLRLRATSQQALLSVVERAENVEGAFAVPDPSRTTGHSFLLIDDVATSGATLASAAEALKQAGAVRVDCLVFARA